MSDRISDIRFFQILAANRSFKLASLELGLTSSAVSQRLTALETRLGCVLIRRSTRGFMLTNEGRLYLEGGRKLLAELNMLEQDVRDSHTKPSGLISVNSSFGFGRHIVAPLLAAFRKEYPKIEIQLRLTERPCDLVRDGFDIGIWLGEQRDSQYYARRLMANRQVLCASPEYIRNTGPVTTLAALSKCESITLAEDDNRQGAWRLTDGHGREELIKTRSSMTTNDGEVALQWCLAGLGVLLRSQWNIREHLASGALQTVMPKWGASADVYAIYPTRRNLNHRTELLLNYLQSALQNPYPSAS
jgi:DNA-binding transcriptional LysR family regulator